MAMNKRIRFTEREPIFFPADSKAKAVAVQQKAAIKLANSPKCDSNIAILLLKDQLISNSLLFLSQIMKHKEIKYKLF